jgi:hypothetical protein
MSLHNDVRDNGLSIVNTAVNEIHICSSDPGVTTFENLAGVTLGKKTATAGTLVGTPANHTTGRKVTTVAVTDGAVSADGTASHFALVDTAGSRVLATEALDASQVVYDGNVFTLTSQYVAIP